MLLRKGSAIVFVLVLLSIVATVSAGAVSPNLATKAGNGGYIVTPVKPNIGGLTANAQASSGSVIAMDCGYTIQQGQTNWHYKYIGQGCPYFVTNLIWGNPSNSLQLTLFTPDGYVFGPLYDNYDGKIDGKITVYLYRDGGLPGGTYYARVYGQSVSGTQSYTI
jgi:hypothetical protein